MTTHTLDIKYTCMDSKRHESGENGERCLKMEKGVINFIVSLLKMPWRICSAWHDRVGLANNHVNLGIQNL